MPKKDRKCGGKIRHATKDGACVAARKAVNVGMDVYRCQSCGGWHIGKTRDPARSANRVTALLARHAKHMADKTAVSAATELEPSDA